MVRELWADDLDAVYALCQADSWSPNDEARSLLNFLGISHTSLSVGDVIQDVDAGVFYQVGSVGFEEITNY